MPLDVEQTKILQEWVKIGVSCLLPIAVVALTLIINTRLNEFNSELKSKENEQQYKYKISEKIVEDKRSIYRSISIDINSIYIYINDVGNFYDFSPEIIIQKKRVVDSIFFSHNSYWNTDTRNAYKDFMSAAFMTYSGPGQPARIRSRPDQKIAAALYRGEQWNKERNDAFNGEFDPSINGKYTDLVKAFLLDINSSEIN